MASIGLGPQGIRRRHVWEPGPSGAYLSGLASGARTSLSPRKGSGATTCCLKLLGRQLLGQPCHVPVAEGLPWGVSPTTALNAGRWAERAQVKVWPAH
jgi:hypothetical protein